MIEIAYLVKEWAKQFQDRMWETILFKPGEKLIQY